MKDKTKIRAKPDIKKVCMWWGVGLIILGMLIMYSANIIIGAIVLMVGVISIVLRKDWNLALIGALIVLLGGTNIIDAVMIEQHFSYIGLAQILLGIFALKQYYTSDKKEVSNKKKIIIIGIVLLVLIILIPTFFSEVIINTEEAKLKVYGEYFISNDSIYSEYSLNKGLESGTYSLEFANNQLTEIEKEVNESEMKINEASKYSLITYTRWSSLNERKEYEEIFPKGYRDNIAFERKLIEAGVFTNKCIDTTGCANGWCKVKGTDFCCPRANMEIIDGHCSNID